MRFKQKFLFDGLDPTRDGALRARLARQIMATARSSGRWVDGPRGGRLLGLDARLTEAIIGAAVEDAFRAIIGDERPLDLPADFWLADAQHEAAMAEARRAPHG